MTVYTKTTWVASTAPGLSATALNNLETQYDDAMTQYSTTTPIAASTTPSAGSTTTWSRGDHVHALPLLFWKTTVSDNLKMSNDTTSAVSVTATPQNFMGVTPPLNLVLGSSIRIKVDIACDTQPWDAGIISHSLGGSATAASQSPAVASTGYTTYTFDGTFNTFGTVYLLSWTAGGTFAYHFKNFRLYADTTAGVPASSWA